MRIAEFETVTPRLSDFSGPIRLEQRGTVMGATLILGLLIPLAALILVPFVMLAGHLAAHVEARDALVAHPAAALQIALGMSLVTILVGWPLRALVDRAGGERIVEIDDSDVTVTDLGALRRRTWRMPLKEFLGLTHHVRTTHSGPRHELILVHPNRRRSILVALADRMTDTEVSISAARLGVGVVPATALYGRKLLAPSSAATPDKALAATSGA